MDATLSLPQPLPAPYDSDGGDGDGDAQAMASLTDSRTAEAAEPDDDASEWNTADRDSSRT